MALTPTEEEVRALVATLRTALGHTDTDGFSPEIEQVFIDDLPALFAAIESQQRAYLALSERVRVKDAALEGAATALEECANILRPRLPSLADNVIGPVAAQARAALSTPEQKD